LTKARSKSAKKRGLPENLVKFLEQRKRKKAEALAGAPVEEQKEVRPTVKRRPRARKNV
jgi:hypothetical protein